MASTYDNDLRLEEMATGENSGSWGTKTNTNLELIADAFSYGTETIADADTTIEIQDGTADAARSLALKINSSADLTTTRTVTLAPNTTSKVWIIENNTSGGQVLTISAGSGTNINIANGTTKIIATDGIGAGSNVVELTQDIAIADMSVDGTLTLDGGDGAVDFAAAGSVKFLDNNAAALVFEEANNAYMTFVTTDGSEAVKFDKALDINADLDIDSNIQLDGTFTVGVNDTGYDVKFFGATAGAYMLWDQSTDDLILGGAAQMGIGSATPYTALDVTHATTNQVAIFRSGDTTATIGFADDTTPLTSNLSVVTLGAEGSSMVFNTNSGRSMTIDSSQRVLIGFDTYDSASDPGGYASKLMLQDTSYQGSSMSITRYGANVSGGAYAIGKSRGSAIGSNAIVVDGDYLGNIVFAGDDGVDMTTQGAAIRVRVDGTPGSNDMPGRLEFYTTADGAATGTERMRIDSDGLASFYYSTKNTRSVYGGYTALTLENSNANAGVLNAVAMQFNAGSSGVAQIVMENASASNQDSSELVFKTGDGGSSTEVMRIDSSQRVLIGIDDSRDDFYQNGVNPHFQVEGGTTAKSSISATQNAASADGPRIFLGKTRGTGAQIVSDGDRLGALSMQGADGADLVPSAEIHGYVDGTPGANDMPGRLVFSTAADGAASTTERMRISNDGGFGFNYYGSPTSLSPDTGAPLYAFRPAGAANATQNYLNFGGTQRSANGLSKMLSFNHGYWGAGKEVSYVGVETTTSTGGSGYGFGDLVFGTGSSGNGDSGSTVAERMRITHAGTAVVTSTGWDLTFDAGDTNVTGVQQQPSGFLGIQNDTNGASTEAIVVNNINSLSATQMVLQYRTRQTIEGSVQGNGSGLSFVNVSDYRKKENITDLSGSLAKIKALRPVTFTHRSAYATDTSAVKTGMIAHEVAEVLPNLVVGEKDAVDEDGNIVLQALSYSGDEMITHLIGAIKELEARITTLEG